MKRLTGCLVVIFLFICFMDDTAFCLRATDYVPYPSGVPAIDAGGWDTHTVALNGDGTVLAVCKDVFGECNVSNWKNIVQVVAGNQWITVGLQDDGTVLAIGYNMFDQ